MPCHPQNYAWYSLRATGIIPPSYHLSIPVLCGSLIMDAESSIPTSVLNSKMILFPQNTLTISQTQVTLDPDVYYATSMHLCSNSGNLQLCVLQYLMTTPCSHFSQTKTLHQVHMLLLVQTSSLHQGLLKWCTTVPCLTCAPQTLRLLKQLPIQEALEFHTMEFHREAPPSSSYTSS